MSRFTRLLPLLLLATACEGFGEPLMGEWELVEVSWRDLKETESTTSPGQPGGAGSDCIFRDELEAVLVIDDRDGEDMEGELELVSRLSMSGDCGSASDSDKESFDVEAEREDRGEYELDMDDFYTFECELDDGELVCEDDDGDEWVFAPAR